LYKVLFPRQFSNREQNRRQAHWDKLAEEEYLVWLAGGKEAWRAWRQEQTRKRIAAEKLLPQHVQDWMKECHINREVSYPPLSPEQRKAEQNRQAEWSRQSQMNYSTAKK
jgi:hypothetical protein